MATIIKGKNPNKPWTVRYFYEGKQKEKSFRTKGEADGFKIKFEHDSREHSFVDPRDGKTTFLEAATRYIDNLDRAPNTKSAYRTSLRASLAPLHSRTLASIAQDRDGIVNPITGVRDSESTSTAKT